jgi:hypothetical protein
MQDCTFWRLLSIRFTNYHFYTPVFIPRVELETRTLEMIGMGTAYTLMRLRTSWMGPSSRCLMVNVSKRGNHPTSLLRDDSALGSEGNSLNFKDNSERDDNDESTDYSKGDGNTVSERSSSILLDSLAASSSKSAISFFRGRSLHHRRLPLSHCTLRSRQYSVPKWWNTTGDVCGDGCSWD